MVQRKPWHFVELKPKDALYDGMCKPSENPPADMAKKTFKDYVYRLRCVRQQRGGAHVIDIICQAADAIQILRNNAEAEKVSANTLKDLIAAVLATVKHVMSERQREHAAGYIDIWRDAHKSVQEHAMAPFNNHKASIKQRAGFVSHAELCAARDNLPSTNLMRLWLAVCTMILCMRAGDYANTKIFHSVPTAEELDAHADNYVVLTKNAQYVHMRKFKTSRCYPAGITIQLPLGLCVEIMDSIAHRHRDYLFVTKAGQPYKRKSFTGFLQVNLKLVLRNADATPQLVRRAYVTEMHARLRPRLQSSDPATAALAREQLTLLAHSCAHSINTHNKYVFDLDDGGSPELLEVADINPLPPAAVAQVQPVVISL